MALPEQVVGQAHDLTSCRCTRRDREPDRKKCIAANRCVLSQALPCTTRLDSRLSETGSAGLRPPPCSPRKPTRLPGRQKPSQFRSVSEAQRGLRTEIRPFSRALRLKSPASLCPQNSVSRTTRRGAEAGAELRGRQGGFAARGKDWDESAEFGSNLSRRPQSDCAPLQARTPARSAALRFWLVFHLP